MNDNNNEGDNYKISKIVVISVMTSGLQLNIKLDQITAA